MEMQIECQRDAIYHDFLDSHGGWHLRIVPLSLACRSLTKRGNEESGIRNRAAPRLGNTKVK